MALRLISKEQTHDVEYGGATIKVSVKPHPWWDAKRDEHTKDGRLDLGAFKADVVSEIVAGWDGIEDPAGNAVEFAADAVPATYSALPEELAETIWHVARGRHLRTKEALGN